MNAGRENPIRHEGGYGLVEMLVAFTVLGAVMAMVFLTLTRSQGQTSQVTTATEERQMARTAIQLLEREARMAGSGWGRNVVYTGGGASFQALNPGFGGFATSDSISLLGAWMASTTTTGPVASENVNIPVSSAAGFNVNDYVLLIEKTNRSTHMFRLTGVNTGSNTLSMANTSSYNNGHTNWPSGGFATGSYVYKATISTYAFDSTNFRKPVLIRRENGGVAQVVAYDVDGFRVYYQMQDGTETRNPINLDMIDKVVPCVFTRRASQGQTIRDSVWAAVRPRTF